jgi:hypothetical protein
MEVPSSFASNSQIKTVWSMQQFEAKSPGVTALTVSLLFVRPFVVCPRPQLCLFAGRASGWWCPGRFQQVHGDFVRWTSPYEIEKTMRRPRGEYSKLLARYSQHQITAEVLQT